MKIGDEILGVNQRNSSKKRPITPNPKFKPLLEQIKVLSDFIILHSFSPKSSSFLSVVL